jgi:hypothetical protein
VEWYRTGGKSVVAPHIPGNRPPPNGDNPSVREPPHARLRLSAEGTPPRRLTPGSVRSNHGIRGYMQIPEYASGKSESSLDCSSNSTASIVGVLQAGFLLVACAVRQGHRKQAHQQESIILRHYASPALPEKYAQLVNSMRCAFSRIVNGRICQVLPVSPSHRPSERSIDGAVQVSEFFISPLEIALSKRATWEGHPAWQAPCLRPAALS